MKLAFYNGKFLKVKVPLCQVCFKPIELRDEMVGCDKCGVMLHKKCSNLCVDCEERE